MHTGHTRGRSVACAAPIRSVATLSESAQRRMHLDFMSSPSYDLILRGFAPSCFLRVPRRTRNCHVCIIRTQRGRLCNAPGESTVRGGSLRNDFAILLGLPRSALATHGIIRKREDVLNKDILKHFEAWNFLMRCSAS